MSAGAISYARSPSARWSSTGSLSSDWGRNRRFLSAFANFYVDAILKLRIRDATAGFKIWRADVLTQIGLDGLRSSGYSFQVEMNYRCANLGPRSWTARQVARHDAGFSKPRLYADRGYDHDKYRQHVRAVGITPVIARRRSAAASVGPWRSSWADGTAVRGAPQLRKGLVRPQRTITGKGEYPLLATLNV